MRVIPATDGSLELLYDSTRWSKWLAGIALVMLIAALYLLTAGEGFSEQVLGLFTGTLLFTIAALAMLETAHLKFDARSGVLSWHRRIAFWQQRGQLRKADIEEVMVEEVAGTRKVPSVRIALRLKNGTRLPLTYGSGPDDGHIASAAEVLRQALFSAKA